MATRTRTLFLLLSAGMAGMVQAQRANKPFDKAHFPDGPALKEAQAALRRGQALFEDGGVRYAEAFRAFEQAHAFNPDNADLNLKMGLCQLNGRHHHKALPYFQAAYELDNATPRIHFLLGMGHQLNAQWDKAIEEYQLHKAAVSRVPDTEPLYNSADQRITECRNGRSLQARPVNAQVSNLGPTVNSEVADYGVLITADGEHMMFTSRRSNSTGGKINKATGDHFEDIYASSRTPQGWSAPVPYGPPVNSDINDACVGLFNDGRTMITYRDQKGTGDLFQSRREGDTWSTPEPLPSSINSPANETSAWFSFDRKQLYFVSDREGGIGGQDIWMSRWVEDERTWGEPENLGPVVNTPEDEEGVFVHPDGRTLYFSSRGHICMGGYDVFKTTLVNGRWTLPENLGWPVNSPDDDLYFVLTANGSTGYFSSVRPHGLGEDDLYRVDFLPETRSEETASVGGSGVPAVKTHGATVLIKGHIHDLKQQKGLGAEIELVDLAGGRSMATFSSDPRTGEYLAVVPGGRDYAMYVRAGGYLLHGQNIRMAANGRALEGSVNVGLQPLHPGAAEALHNLSFEPNKTELSTSSLAELRQLLRLLNDDPKIRLEIAVAPTGGGAADLNERLSLARAQAVVDHLVNNGVAPDRLVPNGRMAYNTLETSGSKGHEASAQGIRLVVL